MSQQSWVVSGDDWSFCFFLLRVPSLSLVALWHRNEVGERKVKKIVTTKQTNPIYIEDDIIIWHYTHWVSAIFLGGWREFTINYNLKAPTTTSEMFSSVFLIQWYTIAWLWMNLRRESNNSAKAIVGAHSIANHQQRGHCRCTTHQQQQNSNSQSLPVKKVDCKWAQPYP